MLCACCLIAIFGIYAALPVFWATPPIFLAGAAPRRQVSRSLVLSAIWSAFASPSIDGWDKGATGSINAERYVIGASLTAAAIALVALRARLTHAAA